MRPTPVLLVLILVFSRNSARAQEPPRLDLIVQTGHTSTVHNVALSGDGKYAVSGAFDRTVILWEVDTGKRLQTYSGIQD